MLILSISSQTINAASILSSDTIIVNESISDCSPYIYQTSFAGYPLSEGLNVNSILVFDTTYIFNTTFTSLNTFGTDSIIYCNSYTWIDGNTYTVSNNTATHTLTNSSGCDSVVTLALTILNNINSVDIQTHCSTYTWIDGNTYTESNNTATHTLVNVAGCDSIVTLDLTILESSSGTDVQTRCDSYTWLDGNTYLESNDTATHTLVNLAGCDSVVTLDLTILESSAETDVQIHCDTYTWLDGNTYSESNDTATYTLINVAGCDSIITLDLTINKTDIVEFIVYSCESYDWNGLTYLSSGIIQETYTNVNGCDSIVSLDLRLGSSSSSLTEVSSCGSYLWNGTNYTESGTYIFQTQNIYGCDSIAELDLTINELSNSNSDTSACNIYFWNGTNYTESGIYTFNTSNSIGCDSTATLNLTIKSATFSFTDAINCDSYFWNGITYLESGIYTFDTTNIVGCDSTATLNLTINSSSTSSTNATSCDSYTWNGITYLESGIYTFDTTNIVGCDSTAILNLTINKSSTSLTYVTSCDSFDWNGTNYTESGTYTFNTSNSIGCDSTALLELTINNSVFSEENIGVCYVYAWNGSLYSQSGTYEAHFTTSSGCDSTAILNLTILTSTSLFQEITTCDNYEWNGVVYTESGTYEFMSLTSGGCDSTAVLELTILNSFDTTLNVSSCISYDWNDSTYTESGLYFLEMTNSNGCDSNVTLDLTIYFPSDSIFDFILCSEDDVSIGGVTYSEAGEFIDTISSSLGCDSVLYVNISYSNLEQLTISGPSSLIVGDTETYSVVNSNGSEYNWIVSASGTINSGQGTNEISIEFTSAGPSSISVVETNLDGCVGLSVNQNIIIEDLLHVNESSLDRISVFPNPLTEQALLVFSNVNSDNFTLEIIDLQGRIVRVYDSITNDRLVIRKESLTEGLYYLHLKGPDGKVNKSSVLVK